MKLLEVFGIERRGVGRNHGEHGLHKAAHGRHHLREFVVGFGVEAGVAAGGAGGFCGIIYAPKGGTPWHPWKKSLVKENFETRGREDQVAGKLPTEEGSRGR